MQFTLVVADFGFKYVGKEHVLHLKHTLEKNYTVTEEWDGKCYIGIALDWYYNRRLVHLSMSGYVAISLKLFSHKQQKIQNQPYPSAKINYGANNQYATQ